mgnify:CR=1 FL=1
MVDTAGTITKAADLMIENGALSVRAFASHGVLSDPATERIEKSQLTAIYFTDSIPLRKESEKIKTRDLKISNEIITLYVKEKAEIEKTVRAEKLTMEDFANLEKLLNN